MSELFYGILRWKSPDEYYSKGGQSIVSLFSIFQEVTSHRCYRMFFSMQNRPLVRL